MWLSREALDILGEEGFVYGARPYISSSSYALRFPLGWCRLVLVRPEMTRRRQCNRSNDLTVPSVCYIHGRGGRYVRAIRLVLPLRLPGISSTMSKQLRDIRNEKVFTRFLVTFVCPRPITRPSPRTLVAVQANDVPTNGRVPQSS